MHCGAKPRSGSARRSSASRASVPEVRTRESSGKDGVQWNQKFSDKRSTATQRSSRRVKASKRCERIHKRSLDSCAAGRPITIGGAGWLEQRLRALERNTSVLVQLEVDRFSAGLHLLFDYHAAHTGPAPEGNLVPPMPPKPSVPAALPLTP